MHDFCSWLGSFSHRATSWSAAHSDSYTAQAAVASRTGLSQNRVSHLENHPDEVSDKQLLSWCSALELEFRLGEMDLVEAARRNVSHASRASLQLGPLGQLTYMTMHAHQSISKSCSSSIQLSISSAPSSLWISSVSSGEIWTKSEIIAVAFAWS